jgi:hypothetical protein
MSRDRSLEGVTFDEKQLASQQKEARRRGPSRRKFLAGAGAVVGLPWLESLAGSGKAHAAANPARLIAWHTPNGFYAKSWFPTTMGPDYTLSPSLMPLANVKKKLMVFQGLQNNDASVVFGSHGLGVSGMLTCVLGTKPAVGQGISVDQVYAKQLGTPSMQVGITNRMYSDIGNPAIYNGCVSWASATQPLQPVIQPGVIFDQIFKGADTSTATSADRLRHRAISTSVLDHVLEEATSLQGRLGATDRRKVDEYLTGVRSVETKIQSMTAPTCSSAGMTKPADTGFDWPTQTKITIDLMVLALQCNSTRVITFMLGNGGSSCAPSFPWLKISGDHHGLAHGQNGPSLTTIDTWHVSQLAYFCEKLDAIDDGGMTMLDNSLVFLSSEIMNGISHDQDNKGILVLGTAGGKFKTGQHTLYAKAPQANLFVAMLNALQVPVTTFGKAGTAPLPGLNV